MVRVRVRLVSLLREAVGGSEVVIEVGEDATLRDVLKTLFTRYPGLEKLVRELEARGLDIVYLVNGRFSGLDQQVRDGDEIVILPPASGG
ncbi:MoaD/ThiS family protein [Hyperthermus butylicus]|uniref:Sulfor transporting protein n=1 Tax=Hyperthermus butylicus (strain DSM 5456 / JCM 9403 / PLM1-5) TaxID=415426 RepID=A2BLS5_HYPBU|nr:MoaD/ThiS family protein [Hyperthermus butylicus]ABM80936.1 putative sulfor transporting protein [Hyperthermus butylicus DSM 5456]